MSFQRFKDQQDRTMKFIENFKQNTDKNGKSSFTLGFIKARLELLNHYWNKFEETHQLLCTTATVEDLKDSYFVDDRHAEIELVYCTAGGYLKDRISALSKSPESTQESSFASHSNSGVPGISHTLPKIPLPKFSGIKTEWPAFRDLFKSMIHENHSLSNVERLHYLKCSLLGEAAQLLRNISVTEDNYAIAWETINERYQNERILVNSYLKLLTSIPPMRNENYSEAKRLLDGTMEVIRALKTLNRPVEQWDDWLVFTTAQKLDVATLKEWEYSISKDKALPTFMEFSQFLEGKIGALEAVSASTQRQRVIKPLATTSTIVKTFHTAAPRNHCPTCNKAHFILFCPAFKREAVNQRREIVQKRRLFFNCLRDSHSAAECKSNNRCRFCGQAHHSLLHLHNNCTEQSNIYNKVTIEPNVQSEKRGPEVVSLFSFETSYSRQILLATARVIVFTIDGQQREVRALLDQGSESCFVSKRLLHQLKLPCTNTHTTVTGIGVFKLNESNLTASVLLGSRFDPCLRVRINAIVLSQLTRNIPSEPVTHASWPHLKGLDLADPLFFVPAEVDLLIGGNLYNDILLEGVRKGLVGTPLAQKTIFGWVLTGTVQESQFSQESCQASNLHIATNPELYLRLEKFWEMEEIPQSNLWSLEEQQCNEHFIRTYIRDGTGRFIVKLPTKPILPSNFGNTKEIALSSLARLEKRFEKNRQLQYQYSVFMAEYLNLGHMRRILEPELKFNNKLVYYLPHHAVYKASSNKLRVVFNASQNTSVGLSLNDCLYSGPKLQRDIREIILRWRKHAFVFCTDIEKMFRQIKIHSDDFSLQRIVWRSSPEDKIEEFCLTTVTYGTSPAPFLANKTLLTLAETNKLTYPLAAAAIASDTYIDDILSGADTQQEALQLQQELVSLLQSGGFTLRKWCANSKELLEHIPEEYREYTQSKDLDSTNSVQTLGITWSPYEDVFKIHVKLPSLVETYTKRTFLSDISKIYDPPRWLAPAIVWTKILFQGLWTTKLDWNESLPENIVKSWLSFRNELPLLENVQLNRWLGLNPNNFGCELHAFCDASTKAFAAVAYLRILHDFDSMEVRLVAAKSKVAPMKTQSLPRLELCGAVLLARLISFVVNTLSLANVPIYAWTDSTGTKAWIQSEPSRWKTFVANRVSEIQTSIPKAVWHHIPSTLNPADPASRGLTPSQLLSHELWWKGPNFLLQNSRLWPDETPTLPENVDLEEKTISALSSTITQLLPWDIVNRWSNLKRLLRITAYCLRWFQNRKLGPSQKLSGHLTPSEIETALTFSLKEVQRCAFPYEIQQLSEGKHISSSSSISKLCPFLDEQGLIRVGRRLQFSALDFDTKHPILLTRCGHFNSLLINDAYQRTLHGGNQLVLNLLRSRFWLLNAKNQIRHFISKCSVCIRYQGRVRQQIMDNLPPQRVNPSRPFAHTGVDYAGPVNIKTRRGRGFQTYKGYICLFVCSTTKAADIELVSELTAQGFLAAYRRFTSRRGICRHLYSDNGTNFAGASAEMKCLFHKCIKEQCGEIAELLANYGTEWHFIPPSAPHFGGLWEAGVKSLKHHLLRVIGQNTLTYEELNTLLVQVEGCLNFRPLYPMSSDPNDLSVLTPGHFLGLGKAPQALPEPSTLEINPSRLTRWQQIQQMNENLWSRWSQEYIHGLQQRHKWKFPQSSIKCGDLVLIKENRLPPSKWLIGRIVKIHPGADGHVRVASVQCKSSIIRRPIVKLCALHTDPNEEPITHA